MRSLKASVRARVDTDYIEPMRIRIGEAALMAQKAARSTFRHLWDAEVQVFSQWGEDGILDYLCDCLDVAKPRAIEFGAGNFTECNTRFLAEHRGASVVPIDARDDLVRTVAAMALNWRTSIWPMRAWITPQSAPELLATGKKMMGGLDILSLDIDGNDYWVAEALDYTGIQIVVVEYNPLFGHTRPVSVPRDDAFDRTRAHWSWLYYGASLPAWLHLFQQRGLSFVGTNRAGNNAFFCRSERLAEIPLVPIDTSDLSKFVDWRVREARDHDGQLSLLVGAPRLSAILTMPLVDVTTLETIALGDLHGPA